MDKFDHLFIAPKDFDKSLAFYRDNLGWKVLADWGDGKEPKGAVLKSSGGLSLTLAEEHESKGDQSWSHGINGERPTVHLNVDDIELRYAEIKDKKSVVVKPEDTHWGTRWMVVRDPDGNLIAFNEPPL
ncbi:MAG: VOC family protein [Bdellovibrionia bacterium]